MLEPAGKATKRDNFENLMEYMFGDTRLIQYQHLVAYSIRD